MATKENVTRRRKFFQNRQGEQRVRKSQVSRTYERSLENVWVSYQTNPGLLA